MHYYSLLFQGDNWSHVTCHTICHTVTLSYCHTISHSHIVTVTPSVTVTTVTFQLPQHVHCLVPFIPSQIYSIMSQLFQSLPSFLFHRRSPSETPIPNEILNQTTEFKRRTFEDIHTIDDPMYFQSTIQWQPVTFHNFGLTRPLSYRSWIHFPPLNGHFIFIGVHHESHPPVDQEPYIMIFVSPTIPKYEIVFIRAPCQFFNLEELRRINNQPQLPTPLMNDQLDIEEQPPVPVTPWFLSLIGWIRGRRVEDSPV
jgi:hypothetical protein